MRPSLLYQTTDLGHGGTTTKRSYKQNLKIKLLHVHLHQVRNECVERNRNDLTVALFMRWHYAKYSAKTFTFYVRKKKFTLTSMHHRVANSYR